MFISLLGHHIGTELTQVHLAVCGRHKVVDGDGGQLVHIAAICRRHWLEE